jgi:hypothetical protein
MNTDRANNLIAIFPANRLREHMATASAVRVTFAAKGDRRVAIRLADGE